jgi:hypothetical protein
MAVLGPVGVFVGGPVIANKAIKNSVVSFTAMYMTNPSTTDYAFDVAADVLIDKVSPMGGVINAMDVDLVYKGEKLGQLHMPAMSVTAFQENNRKVASQVFTVLNNDLWDEFSLAMLNEATVDWTLEGTAAVTANFLGLDVTFGGIPFHKEIPLTCFDGLDDVQMSVFDLTQSTPDEVIVEMQVCLKNPSDISIDDLGQLFFEVFYKDANMGDVTAETSSVLVTRDDPSDPDCLQFGAKGYNALTMSGRIVPSDHDLADEMMSRYLSGQASDVQARAKSPMADSLPLFNNGMQGLELATVLNGDETPLVVGLDFASATITPVDDDSLKMDMVAVVAMQNPLGESSPLNIMTVDMNVNMSYAGSLIGSAVTGLTSVPEPNEVKGNSDLTVPAKALMNVFDKGKALTAFAKDLIQLETLDVNLDGTTSTQAFCPALGYEMNVAGLPVVLPNPGTNPPLPPVTVQGMAGLKDVEIVSYKMPGNVPDNTDGCVSECGVQMELKARVNNPSPFGLVIGTLNAVVLDKNGVTLGDVTTADLTLGPGDNFVTMKGKLAPEGDEAIAAAADFMSTYMQNLPQLTSVLGVDAGDSPVSWLHDVVNGITMSTTFPGAGDDFEALTEIEIQYMEMELGEDGSASVACKVKAKLNVPEQVNPSIIMDVDFSGMEFDLVYPDTNSAVGHLVLDISEVPVVYEDGYITAKFDKKEMEVKDAEGMAALIKDLMLGPKEKVQMVGTAAPHIVTNMGKLQLSAVPFGGETTMYGFNNLLDPQTGAPEMAITKIDIASGDEGVLYLTVDCEVTNPSNVMPEMGSVAMELWTDSGFYIGAVTVDDFTLEASEEMNAVTSFKGVPAKYVQPTESDAAIAAGRLFLSQFVSGVDQNAGLRGSLDGSGTNIDMLKPALSALSTTSVVPGLIGNIMVKSIMSIPSLLHPYDLPTILVVNNPFSTEMVVTSAHNEIFPCRTFTSDTECEKFYDDSAGYYTPDALSVTVPAMSQVTIETHPVALYSLLTAEMIQTLFSSAGGGSLIRIAGTIDISIGGFKMQVDFSEKDVPICLKYVFHDCSDFAASESTDVGVLMAHAAVKRNN